MEVADQWRREWAGTAEYGKVTEGGVTRRIARAMEVLHASAPGARVRVMRAAYHSTAGPGAPASSFMLHSSRRVISSGFNFLESPSTPTKPLELSSTPFGSSQESNGEIENYKVTEPDDIEISEPSKWRSSTGASTIRMPSEESSSTDNASIIDLDLRAKNLHRKYSYDSENSDIQWGKKNSARASPLLDAPVTLSTLKYKSLLNGSNEWNNRRKSYSFEDTSPLNETTLHSNDTFAMESSTDSGICKSSEIVNDHLDDNTHAKYVDRKERRGLTQDESFKDWLHKNRPSSFYKGNHFKSYREHDIVMEDPVESNITLQSTGKVSITLPVTIETDDDYQYKKTHISEDSDRRVKKVEFCKTEVHFTAESGKVNIIATDEKPPPSNDFRKRRSAFVPMNDMMDKPITLFGEKINDLFETNRTSDLISSINSEFIESDENTAATKSILKNKIPKPKPYLLGENMVIGLTSDLSSKDPLNEDISVLTGVSLINRQLQSEKRYDGEITSVLSSEKDKLSINNIDYRTANKGPYNKEGLKQEMYAITKVRSQKSNNEIDTNTTGSIKNKFSALQMSPVQERLKTRQLRDSDLTYFGVDNDRKIISADIVKNTKERSYSGENSDENTFRSVKLIQQISNSVCNSEAESEDAPEYQNVPLNTSFAPIPTPRLRSKYVDKPNEIHEIKMLNPIMEQESAVMQYNDISKSRRSKHKKREETVYSTTRSLSEPPKYNSKERSHRPHDNLARMCYSGIMGRAIDDKVQEKANKCHAKTTVLINKIKQIEDDVPIYENLNSEGEKGNSVLELVSTPRRTGRRGLKVKTDTNINYHKTGSINSHYGNSNERNKLKIIKRDEEHEKELRNKQKSKKNSEESENHLHTVKPQRKINEDAPRHIKTNDKKYLIEKINTDKNNHESRSHSAHRQTNKTATRRLSRENDLEYKRSSGEISSIKTSNKHESKNRSTRSPKEKTIRESPKVQPNLNPNTELESTPNTIMLKLNDKNIPNKDSLNSHVKSKRSEYVINYDDKNGTVSSVRKIKPGPSVSKRKDNPKQIYKDIPKENTVKNKALNKIALLQLADHQRDTNRLSNANRKWKTNVHVQRSCQLL